MDGLRLHLIFFSIHLGFGDTDKVALNLSLSCAWRSCLEPKEIFKAGQKVMILGSKIAFILIQVRHFSKGLYFSFISNIRLKKSDEKWFRFV